MGIVSPEYFCRADTASGATYFSLKIHLDIFRDTANHSDISLRMPQNIVDFGPKSALLSGRFFI
jgi:hypothetical protein